MKNLETMFSSKTDQWATPQEFFDELNREFNFNLDPCADETNHKCETYFDEAIDGLKQSWGGTAYSAILHTAEKSGSGFARLMKRGTKRIRLWYCSFRQERTRSISMTI